MLNSRQAVQIFADESILVGDKDVVPFNTAIELFGIKAVEFAVMLDKGTHNMYGIGDYDLHYLTFKGVQLAITYNNIKEIQKMERMDLEDIEWYEVSNIIDFEERRKMA